MTNALESYKTHNRILLVFAPSAEDERYLEQKRLLAEDPDGLEERDIVVLKLFASSASESLRNRFKVSKKVFTVVLVGKDGSEKERFLEPAATPMLFGLIDQMPMRRHEISEQK